MATNRIKRAVDSHLHGVRLSDSERRTLLDIPEGRKRTNNKMRFALVLALVLALSAVTTVALFSLRETARDIAQTEQDAGPFAGWPLQRKVAAIEGLTAHGLIKKNEEVQALLAGERTEQAAHQAADQAVAALTGQDPKQVGFLAIMQTALGPFEGWTYEEKAWYSRLMADVGVASDGRTYFVMPTGQVDEEEAIRIARREVAKGYQVTEEALDAYQVTATFEIPEESEPGDKQGWWHIQFSAPDNMPADKRLFILFPVFVHPETGALRHSVESMRENKGPVWPDNDIFTAYRAFERAAGSRGAYTFRAWPLDLKAQFSNEVRPLVQAVLQTGDLSPLHYDGKPLVSLIAHSTYRYGLPPADAIPQDKAFTLAKEAVAAVHGVEQGIFPLYRQQIVFYDITNPEQPLWKFVFNAGALDWPKLPGGLDNPLNRTCYRAAIHAHTGETVYAEAFAFDTTRWSDLAYQLKWH